MASQLFLLFEVGRSFNEEPYKLLKDVSYNLSHNLQLLSCTFRYQRQAEEHLISNSQY